MKLREAESFGVKDRHQRRVGDIDADFDDRRRDQCLNFAAAKSFHRDGSFVTRNAAMNKSETKPF